MRQAAYPSDFTDFDAAEMEAEESTTFREQILT